MALRRIEARGAADPADAWERYRRPSLWSTWSPQIVGVEFPGDELHAGGRGRVTVPGGLRLPFTVTAYDPAAMTWSWVVRLGPWPLTLDHEVHPSPVGARTVLHLEGPGWLTAAYAPVAALALRRLVAV